MKRLSFAVLTLSLMLSFVAVGGDLDKTVLKVKGIHCPSCVSMIKKTVKKVNGVEEASVSLETGEVTVLFDPAKKPIENVVRAINKMGYKVIGDDSTDTSSKGCCDKESKE
jgi:Cu+-exporting ATPase